MKFNKWTVALAAIGVVNLTSAARADGTQMSQIQTALSNTTLSGYVDTSVVWNTGPNSDETGGSINLPPTTASGGQLQDGFHLNVVDLVLDKPEDESPWASGYHVELQLGPDSTPGGGITQAYITLRTPVGNGIDWKIGVWDTIVGYESLNDPANPNYTRSYAYGLEPTTHTGILGTYKVSDMVTVQAGVADSGGSSGVNDFAARESQKAYMGDVSLTAPDSWGWVKGGTLYVGIINADDTASGAGRTWFYTGVTMPTPMAALKMGGSFDYVDYHDAGGANSADDSQYDIAIYSTYQASEKLSLNFRAEYLNNSQVDFSNAEEFTATAQYSLWANVLSRVEFRWDHFESDGAYGANGSNHNNFMLAANLIYQF
jgi:Putative beta-barrel porin-2, OmpL-like. bbp2